MAKHKPGHGYPVDKLGNLWGPEKYDNDELPSEEKVRRAHSPAFNKWIEDRLAAARAARVKREKG